MANTKYPNVKVQLSGEDGNAFMLMGRVQKALRNAGATPTELDEFINEATSGDYDHVIQTCMDWVEVA